MVGTGIAVPPQQSPENRTSPGTERLMVATVRLCLLALALGVGCTGGGASDNSGRPNSSNASHLQVRPTNLSFAVVEGDADPVQVVDISSLGYDASHWSVRPTASWLTLSPMSGSSSESFPSTVTAKANLSGLTPGTYSGTITVAGEDDADQANAISVTLIISPSLTAPGNSTSTPTGSSSALSASMAWDGIGQDVLGYYVHYGAQSPNVRGSCAYSQSAYYSLASLANASAPTATISGLSTETTYYFAVSAFDGTLESQCSNEISKAMR